MNNLANGLAEAGRRAEALTATQEAVDLHRELAAHNRDAYLPDLAMSVNNLAIQLAEAGGGRGPDHHRGSRRPCTGSWPPSTATPTCPTWPRR